MSSSQIKSGLGDYVRMRWKRSTGSLVFYMSKGEDRRGVKECEKTLQLRALVEEVFELSANLPKEEF